MTFDTAARILQALGEANLKVPGDASLVRIGSPDLESDHAGVIATLGRPSQQAADTVLSRIAWRWANPKEPFGTLFDPPRLEPFHSTAKVVAG
jgi:DNA-binding LacI/PurR family transcriptional regulator